MKCLILWADSKSANLGVRALAEGTAELLRQSIPSVTSVEFAGFDSVNYLSLTSVVKNVARPAGEVQKLFGTYDLVIDTGSGDSFTDIYGEKRLITMNLTQELVRRSGALSIYGPQTIGPFRKWRSRAVSSMILRNAALVLARDPESAQVGLDLRARNVATTTDVVFALPPVVKKKHFDVLVNVSGLLWNTNTHVDHLLYRREIERLLTSLAQSDMKVGLLAHVLSNPTDDNDVPVVQELAKIYPQFDSLVPDNLFEARELIGSSRLVVGARMHACLNALSCGVPAIPWAYSRKFAPLLESLEWDISFDLRESGHIADQTLSLIKNIDTLTASAESSQRSGNLLLQAARDAIGATIHGRHEPA